MLENEGLLSMYFSIANPHPTESSFAKYKRAALKYKFLALGSVNLFSKYLSPTSS